MFINIGNGNVIRARDIIAILNYDLFTSSDILQEMREQAEKENKLIGPAEEVKSVMITRDNIYLSILSVQTLRKRASIKATISYLDDYYDEIPN